LPTGRGKSASASVNTVSSGGITGSDAEFAEVSR
jgi:hypothetical protein